MEASRRPSDANLKCYKRVSDDRELAKYFADWLFEQLRKTA